MLDLVSFPMVITILWLVTQRKSRPKIVGETCVRSESDYPYGDDDAHDRNDLIAHYSAVPSE